MSLSILSPCRSTAWTGLLGDAFKLLGIAEGTTIRMAEGAEMEALCSRAIVVLLAQLSSLRGPNSADAAWHQLLERCGILTSEPLKSSFPLYDNLDEKMLNADFPDGDVDTVSLSQQSCGGTSHSRFKHEFEKLELLGRGAFGEVWRCRHHLDGNEYAVKVVPFQTNRGDLQHRVAREAWMLALLAPHPGILRYHSSWVEADDSTATATLKTNDVQVEPILALSSRSDANSSKDANLIGNGTFLDTCDGASDGGVTFREQSEAGPVTAHGVDVSLATLDVQVTHDNVVNRSRHSWATLYIQTQLCNKDTLETWISKRNKILTSVSTTMEQRWCLANRACQIFTECVAALDHMHRLSCVHRDVKPSNIFFKSDGRVQLGDFGLAKMVDHVPPNAHGTDCQVHGQAAAVSLVTTKSMDIHTRGLGTPSYASPEQLAGGVYGLEVDVFSLGIVLAELICPVQTQMERAVLFEQLRQARRLPASVETAFPKASCLALDMTHRDPKGRPSMEQINRLLPLVLGEIGENFGKTPIPSPRAVLVGRSLSYEVALSSPRGHVLAVSPVQAGDDSLYQLLHENLVPNEQGLTPQPMQAEGATVRAQRKEPDAMLCAHHNAQYKEPETIKKIQSGNLGQKTRLDFRLFLLLLICRSAAIPGLHRSSQPRPPSTKGYRVEMVDTRAYFGLDEMFTDDFTFGS